jgi:hypothetical protein
MARKSKQIGTPWSEEEIEELRRRYPNERTDLIAEDLGRSVGATYAKAKGIGAKKSQDFLDGPESGRLKGNRLYRLWTNDELEVLRERYPHEKTEVVAAALGRTTTACYARARQEGLKKTVAFLNSPDAGRTDGTIGQGSRFRKGHVPVNKGKKGWQAGGRSVETQFKKGTRPANYCPVGSYRRTTKEQHWVLKVQDHGTQRERWIALHKLVWIEHNGPIPPRHVVRFIDGDVDNVTIENLECISMVENMRRNTIHNLPTELVDVIRTKGVLTRQINQRRQEQREEQNQ